MSTVETLNDPRHRAVSEDHALFRYIINNIDVNDYFCDSDQLVTVINYWLRHSYRHEWNLHVEAAPFVRFLRMAGRSATSRTMADHILRNLVNISLFDKCKHTVSNTIWLATNADASFFMYPSNS